MKKKKCIKVSVNKKQKQLTKHYITLTYLNDILSLSQLKDNKEKKELQQSNLFQKINF